MLSHCSFGKSFKTETSSDNPKHRKILCVEKQGAPQRTLLTENQVFGMTDATSKSTHTHTHTEAKLRTPGVVAPVHAAVEAKAVGSA